MGKRGLANVVQVVLIVLLAVALIGILAVVINQSVIRSGNTIDAEILVLSSEFSIMSTINNPGQDFDVVIRKESGTGIFPTVVLIDPNDKTISKIYSGGDINIYQTAKITFPFVDFQEAGITHIVKVEVYASARDKNGNIVNSRYPKDVKILIESLISPNCGNGNLNDEEVCDDGNTISCDGCREDCSRLDKVCGDGIVECGEGCDDGDSSSGDGCSANCQVEQYWECSGQPSFCEAICGDGHIVLEEEGCDDNNTASCDGCRDDCSREDDICGDDITECDEECDDGTNGNNTDECYDDCTFTYCGDNLIQNPNGEGTGGPGGNGDESCDTSKLGGYTCLTVPGYTFIGGTLDCNLQCIFDVSGCTSSPTCGNGIIESGEACDDDNTVSCDGCAGDCSHVDNICGDNILECSEVCDDDNTVSCDGCSASCSRLDDVCGDGIIECGEECEDGNSNPLDLCYQCALTYCGDDYVQNPNGDESGGYPGPGQEQCDDGANNNDDLPNHCRTNCRNPWCGDGVCDNGESGGGGRGSPQQSPPIFGGAIPYGRGSSQGGNSQNEGDRILDRWSHGWGCWQDCGGG